MRSGVQQNHLAASPISHESQLAQTRKRWPAKLFRWCQSHANRNNHQETQRFQHAGSSLSPHTLQTVEPNAQNPSTAAAHST